MIPFLEASPDGLPCLLDDGSSDWITYGELRRRAEGWRSRLAGDKSLVFLYAHNDIETVAALLGAIGADHAVALLDPALPPPSKQSLMLAYSPEFVIECALQEAVVAASGEGGAPNDALSVLLSTSGSTGSPKFVRLTLANLESNSRAIAEALSIDGKSVASGHLPLHYSFGLSVLTSHLASGARVVLTSTGFMDRDFWKRAKDTKVTHLPGVPFHYSILEKLGLPRLDLPNLDCLTQAGGHLDVDSRERCHAYMEQRGGRFYVMYGQTEASPRMTTLQHKDFAAAPASVGTALPGGSVHIVDPDENGRGEVVYRGPNVMMGYAESRADLAKGDELKGELHTGDLGFVDEAGRLTITGRAKRSAKVFGLRVNLDEVEKLANTVCASAVVGTARGLRIYFEAGSGGTPDQLRTLLMSRYSLPAAAYEFRSIEAVPRTARGKLDYASLGEQS